MADHQETAFEKVKDICTDIRNKCSRIELNQGEQDSAQIREDMRQTWSAAQMMYVKLADEGPVRNKANFDNELDTAKAKLENLPAL